MDGMNVQNILFRCTDEANLLVVRPELDVV